MTASQRLISFSILLFIFFTSCKKEEPNPPGSLQLARIKVGSSTLSLQGTNEEIAIDSIITIEFNNQLDITTVTKNISLSANLKNNLPYDIEYLNNNMTVKLMLDQPLDYITNYLIRITNEIKGASGEDFPGIDVSFATVNGKLLITSITLNGENFSTSYRLQDISFTDISLEIEFSEPLDPADYQSYFILSGSIPISLNLSEADKKVTITNQAELSDYTRYYFTISSNLESANGFSSGGFVNWFYTAVDSSLKFPLISDEELLGLIQQQTFRYFYDFAHPSCGLARERNTSGDVVTIGGSGFGVMALIVGMERGYITRAEGIAHLDKMLGFLEVCDRYHGVWPHWLNGVTGETVPFSPLDDGGDLVETSYMIEGLYTMRQYLDSNNIEEKDLIGRINALADSVEYDWFTRGEDVLYWHWSPNTGWAVNVKISGYNETLITYVMAATSVTHPITAEVYHKGYARNGGIMNGNTYYGYRLPLGEPYGGPLFFTHYTFLGLNPQNLQDIYANYWEQNVNQSLINWAYCADNPKTYVGYNAHSWGLTASDNPWGYSAHSPLNDMGVITPTAALSAIAYTPEQSLDAIRHFYYILGDRLWGEYGFYDAFDVNEGWWATSYIAIDQGPIICMIENYRTGMLWDLFMSCPEVPEGLEKLGFSY